MAELDQKPIDRDAEVAKFLDRDFTQCFHQLRHYDQQMWDICKFSFTAYTALIGIAIALYRYSTETKVDLSLASIASLFVGLILGLLFFGLSIRNRVYFVIVARYINEHRGLFLSDKPLGFQNITKMFTNPTQPPYFNGWSSHSMFLYTLAVLNAALGALLIYIYVDGAESWWVGTIFIIVLGWQLIHGICYLKTRENKPAGVAIFGVK